MLRYFTLLITVNSEIYVRVLFSPDAKFHETKPSQNREITLPFTDVGKSGHEFLLSQICLLTIFVLSIFEWPCYTGFTVYYCILNN